MFLFAVLLGGLSRLDRSIESTHLNDRVDSPDLGAVCWGGITFRNKRVANSCKIIWRFRVKTVYSQAKRHCNDDDTKTKLNKMINVDADGYVSKKDIFFDVEYDGETFQWAGTKADGFYLK